MIGAIIARKKLKRWVGKHFTCECISHKWPKKISGLLLMWWWLSLLTNIEGKMAVKASTSGYNANTNRIHPWPLLVGNDNSLWPTSSCYDWYPLVFGMKWQENPTIALVKFMSFANEMIQEVFLCKLIFNYCFSHT